MWHLKKKKKKRTRTNGISASGIEITLFKILADSYVPELPKWMVNPYSCMKEYALLTVKTHVDHSLTPLMMQSGTCNITRTCLRNAGNCFHSWPVSPLFYKACSSLILVPGFVVVSFGKSLWKKKLSSLGSLTHPSSSITFFLFFFFL